jgi:nitrate/nitrite transporter NarK
MLPTCDPSACGGGSGGLDMLMLPEGFLSDVDVFGKSSECLTLLLVVMVAMVVAVVMVVACWEKDGIPGACASPCGQHQQYECHLAA